MAERNQTIYRLTADMEEEDYERIADAATEFLYKKLCEEYPEYAVRESLYGEEYEPAASNYGRVYIVPDLMGLAKGSPGVCVDVESIADVHYDICAEAVENEIDE